MSFIVPEEKLKELIQTEDRKFLDNGGTYKRGRIPLGFYAVGEEGENVDIAEIVIEQIRIVDAIRGSKIYRIMIGEILEWTRQWY